MSSKLPYHAYTGYWINWDKGLILGSTLTLIARNGTIFLAFLVVFVRLVTVQSWKIVRFLSYWHHVRRVIHINHKLNSPEVEVAHDRRIGLHYQQQIVLRNDASDQSAAWYFFRQACTWATVDRTIRTSLLLFMLAIIHAVIWMLAALFV